MRGLMGTFAVLPLGDLVELLARRRATGTLECERGTVRKSIHLRDGAAVGAASNDPREYLGQLLVNFGHLDEEQLTQAFRTQQETNVRLGKVLAMVGLVAPETVREALALKIRETLLDLFRWDSGVFSLDDAPPPADADELDAAIPLGDLAREAEFRDTAWSAFRGEFPSGAATLEVDEAKVPPALGPETVDGRLLALARDGKSIDEIGLALHATDFHLYQRLYSLARQGIVRAGAPPLPAGAAAGLEDLRALLLEPPRTPLLRVPARELGRGALAASDRYLLSRCDGTRTVADLVRLAPLPEIDVLKAVRRLAEAELLELSVGRS